VKYLLCCLLLLCLACALLGACGVSGTAAPPVISATVEPTPNPLCKTCDSYGRQLRETAAALRPTATAQP
jgi:hypothetical protein